MGFDIQWHSQQGIRTVDNRDCAGIGVRGDSILTIVLDGSTSGLNSGAFAREIARSLVDWFVTGASDATAESLIEQLRITHAALATTFRKDSASYTLLHAGAGQSTLVLHAGDCLVGRNDVIEKTTWLLQPHTLANALGPVLIDVLAKDGARHILTRSFCSKRFISPDMSLIDLDHRPLLIATDGFWAELTFDQQQAFVEGQIQALEHDDRSVLSISRNQGGSSTEITCTHAADNIYVRKA